MFQALLVVLTGGIVHSKHYLIETGQTTRIKSKYLTMNYFNYFILKIVTTLITFRCTESKTKERKILT